MAATLTLAGSLSYLDSLSVGDEASVSALSVTTTNNGMIRQTQSIATTETAITLGSASAPGYAMFINRSATNYVELRVATSGAKFAKLFPGEFALLRLGSGAQAPYAIADTAACVLEIIICNT